MTLDLVLKVLITSILGYITLNTFLKYHFSFDRIYALFMGMLLIISILYLDTVLYFEFGLTVGLSLVLCIVLKLISIKKKRHGYFLFNTFKNQYSDTSKEITEIGIELKLSQENINYNLRKPWLVVLKDVELKKANDFNKKLDKVFSKKPKKLTMYNYWFVVAFLIAMVVLWRF